MGDFAGAMRQAGAAPWPKIAEHCGRGEAALTSMFAQALAASGCAIRLAVPIFERVKQGIAESARLTANAHATLDALTAMGLLVGIISNGFTVLQTHKAEWHGLRGRVRAIVTSEDAGAHKPDSRIFQLACRLLDVRPARSWYVGDNYEKDVIGAGEAGMYTLLFDPEGRYDEAHFIDSTQRPNHVIGDLLDVIRLVDGGTTPA